ncbi:hypothetical protein [Kitasatospora azatica]|uniref:hypothetical protein n=1 Tax=Kitasatospora azatica TaxID=58347 RepID=UPI00055B8647|nr:hypothetical protein [Kitasatospora azatica]
MYDQATRARAIALHRSGLTFSEVSRAAGISRFSIREWALGATPSPRMTAECPLTPSGLAADRPSADYSYLLGLYLGDGCLSEGRKSVYALRIACGNAWPGLIELCAQAMRAVPGAGTRSTRTVNGTAKRYEYPRSFLTNTSTDIIGIFTRALDSVGVSWKSVRRTNGVTNISIARRDCVALLDRHIGPKH